jgi:hypothetical protein
MSRTRRQPNHPDTVLAEGQGADGTRIAVVTRDALAAVILPPGDEADLLAAVREAEAGQTLPADEVLLRLPGR